MCHLDEAGFAPTLAPNYSWSPVGDRLEIPYEATQGRRVNVIGALFSHGPEAGRLEFQTYVSLPQGRAKNPRKTPEEMAAKHGVELADVGPIDATRFVDFTWKLAGRPADAPADWQRERPLYIVLDNYSVHKGQIVKGEIPALEAAGVHLFYLPSYTPELSDIEPIWHDVKHHRMTKRSYELAGDLKQAVDNALMGKAADLRAAHAQNAMSLRRAA